MEVQDSRIATHEFQFSPGGTVTGYRVQSKVVPISELMMNTNKTQTKRSLARLAGQREKLGVWRERDAPTSAVEVGRPALASLDPNVAWTEQLAQELGLDNSTTDMQALATKQQPISSVLVATKKTSKKLGFNFSFGFGKTTSATVVGVENYLDPDWLEKYVSTATPEQMDAYIVANLSTATPAVASLKEEQEATTGKYAALVVDTKEVADATEVRFQQMLAAHCTAMYSHRAICPY